jgi:hypothetical protein
MNVGRNPGPLPKTGKKKKTGRSKKMLEEPLGSVIIPFKGMQCTIKKINGNFHV